MIRVRYSPYTLAPADFSIENFRLNGKVGGSFREGALLRVEWVQKKSLLAPLIGYADLFPWPEFGDVPLTEQFLSLKQKKPTKLIERSIALAHRDAKLRQTRKNGFVGLPQVSSHYTSTNPLEEINLSKLNALAADGYQAIKLKLDTDVEAAAKLINEIAVSCSFRIRLDFNACLNLDLFLSLAAQLTPLSCARIDFVEDPMPWDFDKWQIANQKLPLALDFEADKVQLGLMSATAPFRVIIIKPARQDVDQMLKHAFRLSCKVVITSSMDHPVGVAHAALYAAEIKRHHPNLLLDCGLMTLDLYEPNDFNRLIKATGSTFFSTVGVGVGFDDLFADLSWKNI